MQMHSPQGSSSGICVIIASYNAQTTIARAITSALAEPEAVEVVVVDDASTDKTVEAAYKADDGSGRLSIVVQPQNAGPSAARNRAIRESKASWIAILDADDFFLPGRLKGLLAYADQADFIADDMWQVPEQDVNGPRRSLLDNRLAKPKFISFADFVLSNVTGKRNRAELGFIKPLIRRQFLDTNHIRYQEHMRLGEDFELYARSLALGARLLLVPAQGYVSVVRRDSLSGKHTEADLLNLRNCDGVLIKEVNLPHTDKAALRKHYVCVDCRLQWRLLILAVKNRDIKAAFMTFLRPWPVPFYLFKQLTVQFFLRTFLGKNNSISLFLNNNK